MYKIRLTKSFRKSLKRISKSGQNTALAIEKVVEQLACGNKLDRKHKDHLLAGEYAGYRECHIKPDLLLIYVIEQKNMNLFLVDIGSHSELFQ